jgi:transcriptional regulator GlxA family with amidase domain
MASPRLVNPCAAAVKSEVAQSTVAKYAGISPRQFARIFLKETGDTPAHAIERLRAEAALPQIQDGFESMEGVARNVGFRDME